jgi:hypothetical protein
MPHQVDDALLHAMSGTELSRVRTELRLLPREPIKQVCSRRGGPALLCNQVPYHYFACDVTPSTGPTLGLQQQDKRSLAR